MTDQTPAAERVRAEIDELMVGTAHHTRLLDAYAAAVSRARDEAWREAVEAVRGRATTKPGDNAIERAALGLVHTTLDALLARMDGAK